MPAKRRGLVHGGAIVVALSLGVSAWLVVAPHTHAQTQEPVRIRVEITENGFNGQPDFSLDVEQGQVVELTFVFAHAAALADRHIIVLKGYGLETPEIDYYNREATLRFVADKPGTFELMCDLDCDVHDKLQSGHLKVKRGAGAADGAASPALMPTTLAAYPSAWETSGEAITLSASLKDASGSPVPRATVRFLLDAEFAGAKGQMEIAQARTDAGGNAVASYKPTFPGRLSITAHFEGMGLYGESQQAFDLGVREAEPAYVVGPRGLEAISDRLSIGIAVVVLSIWSAFAYVLSHVYRISRAST